MKKNTLLKTVLITLMLVSLMPFVSATINATLVDLNNNNLTTLEYDWFSSNLTSNSYRDNSIINPNAYLRLCTNQTDELLNKYATLAYASESGNLSIDILDLPAQINSLDSSNCSYLDIDISSYSAFYPSIPFAIIADTKNVTGNGNRTSNQTNYTSVKLTNKLNGSYLIGASVDSVAGITYFQVLEAYDSSEREIPQTSGNLIMTLLGANGSVLGEQLVQFDQLAGFDHSFQGGETLYVNGLLSLEIKVLSGCGTVNESGYYFLNSSSYNNPDECITVNASYVTINFANKTIDGDGNESRNPPKCAIKIINSIRSSLIDVRASEYYRGLCVFNSTDISVSGTSSQVNDIGIYVYNSTDVSMSNLIISNNESEFSSYEGSTVFLSDFQCDSANFSLDSKDVSVRPVSNPPEDIPGFNNISQWLEVSKNGNSWANVKFHYDLPLPNNVLLSSVLMWKNNATFANSSWNNGTWEMIATSKIDPVNGFFYTDNISNFSIFAPMGEKINATTPEPKPTPGGGGGGGGTAGGGGGGTGVPPPPITRRSIKHITPKPPQIDLELMEDDITLQQGQSANIDFNLSNIGEVGVDIVTVYADVNKGWDFSGVTLDTIKSGEVYQGEIFLKVFDDEVPGDYLVAVLAMSENFTLDTEILKVKVTPRDKLPQLTVLEAAPAVTFFENTINDYEMLVKNTGDFDLTNVTARLVNCECIGEQINGSYDVNISQQKTLIFKMEAGEVNQCSCVTVLQSNEYEALSFSPFIVSVVPRPPEVPLFLPILVSIWTLITAYIMFRRYRKRRAMRAK